MLSFMSECKFVNNEIWRLVVFFSVVLLSLVVGKLSRLFLVSLAGKIAKRPKQEWIAILLSSIAKPAVILVFALGFKLALFILTLGDRILELMNTVASIINSVALGYFIYSTVDVVDHYLSNWAKKSESKVDDVLAPLVGKAIRIMVAVLVVLNIAVVVSGKDIATILTGIGVGGLAIALAGQDTIKNFFGSLVIFGDKPFEIGDRIVVEGIDGSVESVGFRSTKIRTLDGHLVTMPNSEMVDKAVKNIGKRPYIKRAANITITYNTSPEKVARAIELIKEILDNHEGMHPDFPPRVYFNDYNDWSLNIMFLYWYHPPDYWQYMAFSERVNMQILQQFNAEGIEFAFPTQTLYINR